MNRAEAARFYEEAKKDDGLYAKRYVELYEKTTCCVHGNDVDLQLPRPCTDDCFKPG